MLSAGDCTGAFQYSFAKGRIELGNEIKSACEPRVVGETSQGMKVEQSLGGVDSTPTNAVTSNTSQLIQEEKPLEDDATKPQHVLDSSEWQILDEWKEYFASGTGSVYFYNVVPQDKKINRKEIWVKSDDSKNNNVKERSSMSLYEIYCNERKIRMLQYIDYDKHQRIISKSNIPLDMDHIIPETMGGYLYDEICVMNITMKKYQSVKIKK